MNSIYYYRKHLLNSPLLSRRQRKSKTTESSDDEIVQSGDEVFSGKNYRDLESFQKAQLRQKVYDTYSLFNLNI
jgi:hypothetical protein